MKKMRAEKALIFFQTFFKKHLTFTALSGIIISERERKIPNTRKVSYGYFRNVLREVHEDAQG